MTEPAPEADGARGAQGAAAPAEVLPRKFGKYTLLRSLAKGGMAELYLALHRSLAGFERLVVIKRILSEFGRDQAFITMLLQEARIAATFSHPNIVTIFDVGQAEGEYFIAMEHIHGEDLRSVVRAMKPRAVKEFPLEHALAIGLGAAAGLAYAHEKKDLHDSPLQVVHRDISPQNLVITYTGDVKVVDFGIAKATLTRVDSGASVGRETLDRFTDVTGSGTREKADGPEHDTKAGQIKGKIPYMSPEQARGEALDARSDIFSLGIILWELCTGRRLFRGPNEQDTLRMITDGQYPGARNTNPRVSEALDRVLMKAIAPSVVDRYQSARELQSDLESVIHAERVPVSTVALGKWMEMLFEDRIAAQRAALAEGKQLADVLAAEDPDPDPSGVNTIPPKVADAVPPRASRRPLVAAGLVALFGVAVAAWALTRPPPTQTVTPAAAAGAIVIDSAPEGAHIWINDAVTPHRTPHTLTGLTTGADARFRVRLTAEGYEPFSAEVQLTEAQPRGVINARLERARANGMAILSLSTTPAGARVVVDGRELTGVTPLDIPELAPAVEHTIVIRHPDAVDETLTFVGVAGRVENRAVALRERPLGPAEAFVNVALEPPEARLRVDTQEAAGASPYHLRVSTARPITLVASAPGHTSESRVLRPRAGETLALPPIHLSHIHAGHAPPGPAAPATPPAPVDNRPGRLTIGSTPWCNVTVDRQAHGQTPVVGLSLPPGRHTVLCVNPEAGTQTRTVELQPGQDLRLRITFPGS
ncbi:MAG: protein kinase [Myxococcales bacterium]|nr:protein kinase [Myxococcales bacterium]